MKKYLFLIHILIFNSYAFDGKDLNKLLQSNSCEYCDLSNADLKKKNLKLAILSNGTPDLINELVNTNKLDTTFDDLFSIEEVKIYKPDSRVYDLPVNKYKIQPKEVIFLSANTWDVSGGGNFGYNAVWVNRNNSHFDNLDYKPKKEIKNLKGLLEIV